MWELLKDCLPSDHAEQVSATYYVEMLMRGREPGCKVLDVGCGVGRSLDVFRKHDSAVDWHGLDIESSPEVNARRRTDANFISYDGINIPFADDSFDLVYSTQVFEHVRYPSELLGEVCRVLRPGGAFFGSVSTLEPYHSFSFWNYTPFGWHTLLLDAGLKPVEFRPGIDSIALIQRQYRNRPPEARAWFTKSPLNEEIDRWGAETGRRSALINLRKLQFCGHLIFYARKPVMPES